MSRIDIPTLMCDRCRNTTQDVSKMGGYRRLAYWKPTGNPSPEEWDLCPTCWNKFIDFLGSSQ